MQKDSKGTQPVAVDVEHLVDGLQRCATAVDIVEADMRWYDRACRSMRRHTVLYAVAAGALAVVLVVALLPTLDYGYMVGDRASMPHEVCEGIRNVLDMI